jgi:hypothetical protein
LDNLVKAHQNRGKEKNNIFQFENGEETSSRFNFQANAAICSNTIMARAAAYYCFGINGRKNNADRQREEQNFPFQAQFHGE